MKYIIQRDDGAFVSPPGSERSYTAHLQFARTFPTREAAERECCANERVRPLEECVR